MMKKAIIISFTFLALSFNSFSQSETASKPELKGAIGVHPLTNSISYRTNRTKKHFMDFRVAYNFGSAVGVPFANFNAYTAFMWRRKQSDWVNYSWGIGASLTTFNPSIHIPLDIEFFPLEKAPQLSIGAQVLPSFLLKKSTELSLSTTIQTDFTIRYYFEKKNKSN